MLAEPYIKWSIPIRVVLRFTTNMFVQTLPLLLCLAVAAFAFPEGQIVGGRDAPVGKFPYQVSLRKNGRHFCGGSIVNARIILTAAHCVDGINNVKEVTVHVGTNQLNSNGDKYGVEKIVAHNKFSIETLLNDVALIRVNKNIVFKNVVQPIQLASGGTNFEGKSCILSGWGTTRVGGNAPNNLQYINLVVETQSKCKKAHSGVKKTQICTFTKYGEGACHGDSGGPLAANGVQIGIVSFGQPCGVGKPDVYTRVSAFRNWINSHQTYMMNEEDQQQPEDGIYIF